MITTLRTIVLTGVLVLIMHNHICAEDIPRQKLGSKAYLDNCAICHGDDGKGKGPRAEDLSVTPSNLTILSKENGGSFPETVVYNIIDGRRAGDYHGQEMPIWGQHFIEINDNEEYVDERITELIDYLESIQIE